MDTKEHQSIAAQHVKRVFSSSVASGGGGRGGSANAVYNKATASAQFVASVFADYFSDLDADFEPDAFFRECCLSKEFVERMVKARVKHGRKQLDSAWRQAKRLVGKGA